MSEKISGHHLERGAYVYVRQSTPYQVRHHVEGKERQYALADRAKQLGFAKVIVIDDDWDDRAVERTNGPDSVVCWQRSVRV